MTIKRSGLGRNLSALLGSSSSQVSPVDLAEKAHLHPLNLPCELLQPGKYQPRILIEDEALKELAASIAQQGLLQPILIRALDNNRYEIIAGERRWRASQLAGLTHVPVLLRKVNDETAMAMALVENLQREELTCMEMARAIERLHIEFLLTHDDIATLLSKSRSSITNFLRILTLSKAVLTLIENQQLSLGHAKVLLSVDDESTQEKIAALAVNGQWSVRETERKIQQLKTKKIMPEKVTPVISIPPELERLAQSLNTSIDIKRKRSGKGTVLIHYQSPAELQRVIALLSERSQLGEYLLN